MRMKTQKIVLSQGKDMYWFIADTKTNTLKIKKGLFGKELIKEIPFADIISFDYYLTKDVAELPKSVIKRAIVGGLLLGPAGAVVGGISGTGTKTKESNGFFTIDIATKNGTITETYHASLTKSESELIKDVKNVIDKLKGENKHE